MKCSWILIGVISGYTKKYKTIYAFGDSISDNGNLYELMGRRVPSPLYYKRRFSNGPVWVEYLANQINATLFDYAFGSATTDNDEFLAPITPPRYYVPGCIQQVQRFADRYTPTQGESLVSMIFLGNDFFRKEATARKYVDKMELCLSNLISKTNLTNIMIANSNAPELAPAAAFVSPEILTRIKDITPMISKMLRAIKSKFPESNIYSADVAGLLRSIANKTNPLSDSKTVVVGKACLDPPFDFDLGLGFGHTPPKVCGNPQEYMFWDGIHPSTQLHKAIADYAAKALTLA